MIDTHAHIHDRKFDDDRDAVIDRMRQAGVQTAITVGCDLEDSQLAQNTAHQYGLYASVGIHPHEAKDAPEDIPAAFEPFFRDELIVAIGETGLDYYYRHSPAETQLRVLREQIRLARERGYPVIFHHRDAFRDFTNVLRDEWDRSTMKGVVHCFSGDIAQAKTFVEGFGLFLGIGGMITFKAAQHLRDAVAAVGIDALILETDCPYLAPVPHRGTRNEPAFMAETARRVGQVLGIQTEDVIASTTKAARRLFGLDNQEPRTRS